jgi:hypothetical protein
MFLIFKRSGREMKESTKEPKKQEGIMISALFNGRLKYLFLAPIAMMIGFSLFYYSMFQEINEEFLTEKMIEKRMEIEQISTTISAFSEYDPEGSVYDYEHVAVELIEYLDQMYGVYAAVYNEQMQLLSRQSDYGSNGLYDPLQDPGFIEASARESGELALDYDQSDPMKSKIHLYFKWIPTGPHRVLSVIGITTHPKKRLMEGMILQIIITFAVNVAFVILLCYLGTIYGSRHGKKWRSVDCSN